MLEGKALVMVRPAIMKVVQQNDVPMFSVLDISMHTLLTLCILWS